MSRENHLVELVDQAGMASGESTVDEAHRAPGRLHRAFSVLILDPQERLLLQRRAATKTRFPLRWANACCGHPAPAADLTTAAQHRLAEELGVTGIALVELGIHRYRAQDPATGRVEYEYDHVLLGQAGSTLSLTPDPAEVAEVRWATPAEVRAGLAHTPDEYAPWLPGVLELLVAGGRAGAR